MAATTDLEVIRRVIETQGITVMEATEAGADRMKIDYCEGSAAEIIACVENLYRSVRGLFVVRCWNEELNPKKPGKPTTRTAPFQWKVNGLGGFAPIAGPSPAPIMATRDSTPDASTDHIQALADLRLQLEVMRQSHQYEREIDQLQLELDEADQEPQADAIDQAERIGSIVDRVLDRVLPYFPRAKAAPPSAAIQGPQVDVDKDTALLVAIANFRAAEPEQFAAVSAQLLKDYGQPEPAAPQPERQRQTSPSNADE